MTHNELYKLLREYGWEELPEGYFHPDNPIGQTRPNYLADLNSMHEAKKLLLDEGLMREFVNQLVGITCSASVRTDIAKAAYNIADAIISARKGDAQ